MMRLSTGGKKSIEPCVVEAPTGSGKSVMVAMIAQSLFRLSKGKRAFFALLQRKNWCAKTAKNTKHLEKIAASIARVLKRACVIKLFFATPDSFKKVAKRLGHEFAGIILDEAHRITNTVQQIIADIREGNPQVRVCGLSATPYRTDQGFIFCKRH